MPELSNSEWLFYGGIALMAAAAVLCVFAVVIFMISGRRLRKKLEQEFGTRRR